MSFQLTKTRVLLFQLSIQVSYISVGIISSTKCAIFNYNNDILNNIKSEEIVIEMLTIFFVFHIVTETICTIFASGIRRKVENGVY